MDYIKNATRILELLSVDNYKEGTSTPEVIHSKQVEEILTHINAPDHIICAGLLHNIINKINITDNELRKLIGAQSILSLKDFQNISNRNFSELTLPEKMMFLADVVSNTRIICDELKKQNDKLWINIKTDKEKFLNVYKKILSAFLSMKKTPLLDSEFAHNEVFKVIDELKENIKKIEEYEINKSLPMPDIIKEGQYYAAYDKEGNVITRAQSYQEAKQDLLDDGYSR